MLSTRAETIQSGTAVKRIFTFDSLHSTSKAFTVHMIEFITSLVQSSFINAGSLFSLNHVFNATLFVLTQCIHVFYV